MSPPALNEDVVEQVDALGWTEWSGQVRRYTSAGRDPLSGEGASKFGGRWNPRGVFPAVYLGEPLESIRREFVRAAEAAGIAPAARARRANELHTIDVRGLRVLDLRETETLNRVGLSEDDIRDDDWTACQVVGHAAWFLDYEGVVARSATGVGIVVTAFEERVRPGVLRVVSSEPYTPAV